MACALLGGGNGHVSAGSSDANAVTTAAVDSTGATLAIVGAIWYQDRGTPTITDSKSNSYTALTKGYTDRSTVQFFYKVNPTVGSGHTVTNTNATSYPTIFVWLVTGNDLTAPFEAENGAGDGTSMATGAVVPAANGAFIVSIVCDDLSGGTSQTLNNGFTLSTAYAFNDAQIAGRGGYLEQAVAASMNPTWSSLAPVVGSRCAIAAFKAGAGGDAGPLGKSVVVLQAKHRASYF